MAGRSRARAAAARGAGRTPATHGRISPIHLCRRAGRPPPLEPVEHAGAACARPDADARWTDRRGRLDLVDLVSETVHQVEDAGLVAAHVRGGAALRKLRIEDVRNRLEGRVVDGVRVGEPGGRSRRARRVRGARRRSGRQGRADRRWGTRRGSRPPPEAGSWRRRTAASSSPPAQPQAEADATARHTATGPRITPGNVKRGVTGLLRAAQPAQLPGARDLEHLDAVASLAQSGFGHVEGEVLGGIAGEVKAAPHGLDAPVHRHRQIALLPELPPRRLPATWAGTRPESRRTRANEPRAAMLALTAPADDTAIAVVFRPSRERCGPMPV